MNPLDKKLNQAIADLRDETGRTMSTTRSFILARMRKERMLRWGLGGGGAALLTLAAYVFMSVSDQGSQPHVADPSKSEVTVQVSPPTMINAKSIALPSESFVSSESLRQKEVLEHGLLKEPVGGVGLKQLSFNKDLDGFIEESTAIAKKATEAAAADDLVRAAKTFRGLAILCEKRLEWKRAVHAYDSAVAYAAKIGDKRMLSDLTRDQASALKNAAPRN